jgi:hypothetical protein
MVEYEVLITGAMDDIYDALESLNKIVNAYCGDGMIPLGGPSVVLEKSLRSGDKWIAFQAVTRNRTEET